MSGSQITRRLLRLFTIVLFAASSAACAGLTPFQSFRAIDRLQDLRTALAADDFAEADRLVGRYDDVLSANVALDLAIREGDVDAVEHFLLRADLDGSADADGTTPLIRALQDSPPPQRAPVLELLLKAGADPMVADRFARSAMDYARFSGDELLVRFLESGGEGYYSALPAQRVDWLPRRRWADAVAVRAAPSSRSAPELARSPLDVPGGRAPTLLFASAWLPQVERGEQSQGEQAQWSALRFFGDGTGKLVDFDPASSRIGSEPLGRVAWDFHRESLVFTVLAPTHAAYCRSVGAAPGRIGIDCIDYGAPGSDVPGTLGMPLDDAAARRLLDSAQARARLQAVGDTSAVLEAEAGRFCTPRRAAASDRRGLPVSAASTRALGDWFLFDARRFQAHSPDDKPYCSQRDARAAAFRSCNAAGGNCRSVGGCRGNELGALASVSGHDWAVLACDADIEVAKRKALAQCRERAGCDCQIIHTGPDRLLERPALCR